MTTPVATTGAPTSSHTHAIGTRKDIIDSANERAEEHKEKGKNEIKVEEPEKHRVKKEKAPLTPVNYNTADETETETLRPVSYLKPDDNITPPELVDITKLKSY